MALELKCPKCDTTFIQADMGDITNKCPSCGTVGEKPESMSFSLEKLKKLNEEYSTCVKSLLEKRKQVTKNLEDWKDSVIQEALRTKEGCRILKNAAVARQDFVEAAEYREIESKKYGF